MRFTKQQYAQALHEALQETTSSGQDKVIDNFIKTLKANGDLGSYESIITTYEEYDKNQRGVSNVEVTTTSGATVNKSLISDLNKFVGKDTEILHTKDDKIIGGVVIRIDDTLVDGSVKNHLDNLHKTLKGQQNG
jgi:F-type H+-transporting ATPase subunit delta